MKKLLIFFAVITAALSLNFAVCAADEIIIDDLSAGYSESNSTFGPGTNGYGGSHRSGRGNATYSPVLEDGYYTVSLYNPYPGSNNGTGIYVEIFHSGGTDKAPVDMANSPEGWMELGTYHFNSGENKVILHCAANSMVRADAMRFEWSDPSESDDAVVLSDISECTYSKEIKFVTALGFMQPEAGSLFSPGKAVTRAEFVKTALKIAGTENIGQNGLTYFSDVNPENPYSAYINAAYETGLVSGYSDGSFRPEKTITYDEAIKVFVDISGRKPKASVTGGYKEGYAKAALGMGLSAPRGAAGEVTREGLAYISYKLLHASYLEAVSYGGKTVYRAAETVLEKLHDISQLEGIVDGNEFTALDQKSALGKNYMTLGGIELLDKTRMAWDYIGCRVKAYIKEADGRDAAVYLELSDRNDITVIHAADLVRTDSIYSIKYTQSGKTHTAVLSGNTDVIYNGLAKTDFTVETLNPKDGFIVLIDSDNDGTCDTVKVFDVVYDTVMSLKRSSGKLILSDGVTVIEAEYKSDSKSLFVKNGRRTSISDVKKDNTVGYACADGGAVKIIFISDSAAEGTVTSYDDGERTAYIDEKPYRLTQRMTASDIKVGASGVFFLNNLGEIAAADGMLRRSGEQLACVLKKGNVKGISGGLELKLLLGDGTIKALKTASGAKLNGKSAGGEEISAKIEEDGLIIISLNSKGEISSLKTPQDKTSAEPDDANEFSKNYSDKAIRFIGAPQKSFSGRYIVGKDTEVFLLPSDEDARDEEYKVGGEELLEHYNTKYNIKLYDVDSTMEIGAISARVADSVPTIEKSSQMLVVSRVIDKVDSDGEWAKYVCGWYRGKEVSYKLKDKKLKTSSVYVHYDSDSVPENDDFSLTEDVKAGQGFLFSTNIYGEIENIVMLLDINADKSQSEKLHLESGREPLSKTNTYSVLYTGRGYVTRMLDSRFLICTNAAENWIRSIPFSNAAVYLYENGKVSLADKGDISVGDNVFVRTRYQDTLVIYIIRG